VFNRKPIDESHQLDETISNLISEIAGLEPGSEVHNGAIASLKTLTEIRFADKTAEKRPTVSPDVIVSAATSIFGILAILGFEKANVVTSKAMAFVQKPKI
jgi:hypothetical protein